MKNRFLLGLICVATAYLVLGCEDSSRKEWNAGYEAAWEGKEALSSFWTSKSENEGYKAGLDDVWTYDTGYYDGYEKKRPKYFNDPLYMEAYRDGEKNRERRQ